MGFPDGRVGRLPVPAGNDGAPGSADGTCAREREGNRRRLNAGEPLTRNGGLVLAVARRLRPMGGAASKARLGSNHVQCAVRHRKYGVQTGRFPFIDASAR